MTRTNEQLIDLLADIDELLCMLEDTAHGREGQMITEMRGKIIRTLVFLGKQQVNENNSGGTPSGKKGV